VILVPPGSLYFASDTTTERKQDMPIKAYMKGEEIKREPKSSTKKVDNRRGKKKSMAPGMETKPPTPREKKRINKRDAALKTSMTASRG